MNNELPKKGFFQTLDPQTRKFLERWYNLPIQDILRVLAAVDVKCKEQDFTKASEEYLKKLQEVQK